MIGTGLGWGVGGWHFSREISNTPKSDCVASGTNNSKYTNIQPSTRQNGLIENSSNNKKPGTAALPAVRRKSFKQLPSWIDMHT